MFNDNLCFDLDLLNNIYLFDRFILRKILELVNNELERMKYGKTEVSVPSFHGRTQKNKKYCIKMSGLDDARTPITALSSRGQQTATFDVNDTASSPTPKRSPICK